ncbi:MAG: hypothetical protein QOI94_2790, partial [Acidobacteriaceae bacterium]|nr:hypothetical protein [Acidobacteriaceae bacterium]
RPRVSLLGCSTDTQPGDRQDVPHTRTTTATYIKSWIAIYSDSKVRFALSRIQTDFRRAPFLLWRQPPLHRPFESLHKLCATQRPPMGAPTYLRQLGFHLVEYAAALRALDGVRCQTHQLILLNLVATKRTSLREVEIGLSFEPRHHHPTRPSAERTGFRVIRRESGPRNTSDGR